MSSFEASCNQGYRMPSGSNATVPINHHTCNLTTKHGPACIAYHYSHIYITNPGSVSHFDKTWASLQTTTYISKSTKYFDILLLFTCEEVLMYLLSKIEFKIPSS